MKILTASLTILSALFLTLDAAHAQLAALRPRGGMDANTVLHAPLTPLDGMTLQQWAGLISGNATALAGIQQSGTAGVSLKMVGTPGGVAALDPNGNSVAPVNSAGKISTSNAPAVGDAAINSSALDSAVLPVGDLLATGRANFRSMIDGQTIMRVTGSHRQANPQGEDNYTDPDGIVIGGYAPGRGSHVIITAQDEGGMNLGAVVTMWNSNDRYTGNRPGLSPTTATQMAHYINTLDSVVLDNGTKSTTPKILAGPQINDSTGVAHSIFFTKGSVFIFPQLSAADEAKLKQFQTIVSNVSMPQYVNSPSTYVGMYGVNGFSGMVNNWQFSVPCPTALSNSNGVCDRIDVDQWVIPGQIPTDGAGLNPQDYAGTSSNIDNHYDLSVTQPTLYIGARTKQFNLLDTCTIVDNDTQTDLTGPLDSAHSLVRECENGEYDNELHTAISGKYHYNGLTIGVDSHVAGKAWNDGTPQTDGYNAWPDLTSRAVYLGGQFPTLLQLEPFTAPFVWSIKGNTFAVTNPLSAGSAIGSKAMASMLFKNAGTSSMREDHWEQCEAAQGQTCTTHQNMVWHIGLRVGAGQPESENQTNPTQGAAGSNIGFGGDGTFRICQATGTCDVIGTDGGLTLPYIVANGIAGTNGSPLSITSAIQVQGGTTGPFANFDGIGAKTAGGVVTFTSAVQNRGLVGDAVYTLSQMPMSGVSLIDGAHAWCSDCKINGIIGVEAYWHNAAGKWTDAMNNALVNQ